MIINMPQGRTMCECMLQVRRHGYAIGGTWMDPEWRIVVWSMEQNNSEPSCVVISKCDEVV